MNKNKNCNKMDDKPAIIGGKPILDEFLPIIQPTLPKFEEVEKEFKEIFESGMITNYKYVKEFEEKSRSYIGVKNAVALGNATSGLIATIKALKLKGEIITPSFTFVATTHSIIWSGLQPVFVDCDSETFNIDTKKIEEKITPHTSAILAVNIFGNPCNIDELQRIAKEYNLKLIFDSSHAFGSVYKNKMIGSFGDAEIFCYSPTKILTCIEGGLITTNNDNITEFSKGFRDYGNFRQYDCRHVGLSSRMEESNAIIGAKNLEKLEECISKRNHLVEVFKRNVIGVDGIRFQKIDDGCRSVYQAFVIIVEPKKFGLNRDQLALALKKENIMTKTTYFFPAVHRQNAYEEYQTNFLPETKKISENILCLPLFSHLSEEKMILVAEAIKRIHKYANEIKEVI